MRHLLVGALIITSTICAVPFAKAENKAIFNTVDQYSEAIGKFQSDIVKTSSLENVYHQGQAAASKLIPALESLSPVDFDSIVKKMRGYVINRDEVIFVLPDFKFFGELSKKQGTDADVAFFAFMSDLRPANVWPAFIEQQTDYSGCTDFGKGLLTNLYRKAVNFSDKNQTAYKIDIDEVIREIKAELTESTCACGDMDSAIKEFNLFISTFPAADVTPMIKKRILDIKSNKSFMRFNCTSG